MDCMWPSETEIFTLWPFTLKVGRHLIQNIVTVAEISTGQCSVYLMGQRLNSSFKVINLMLPLHLFFTSLILFPPSSYFLDVIASGILLKMQILTFLNFSLLLFNVEMFVLIIKIDRSRVWSFPPNARILYREIFAPESCLGDRDSALSALWSDSLLPSLFLCNFCSTVKRLPL